MHFRSAFQNCSDVFSDNVQILLHHLLKYVCKIVNCSGAYACVCIYRYIYCIFVAIINNNCILSCHIELWWALCSNVWTYNMYVLEVIFITCAYIPIVYMHIFVQNWTEATVHRKQSWDPFAVDYKFPRVHRHQGYQ